MFGPVDYFYASRPRVHIHELCAATERELLAGSGSWLALLPRDMFTALVLNRYLASGPEPAPPGCILPPLLATATLQPGGSATAAAANVQLSAGGTFKLPHQLHVAAEWQGHVKGATAVALDDVAADGPGVVWACLPGGGHFLVRALRCLGPGVPWRPVGELGARGDAFGQMTWPVAIAFMPGRVGRVCFYYISLYFILFYLLLFIFILFFTFWSSPSQ